MKDLLTGLVLDLQNTEADLIVLQFRKNGTEVHIGFDFFSPELYLEDQEQSIDYPNLLEMSDLAGMIYSGQSTIHLVGSALNSSNKRDLMLSLQSSADYVTSQLAPLFKTELEIVVFKNGWIYNGVVYNLN